MIKACGSSLRETVKNMEDTQSMTNFYWWDHLWFSLPPDFLFVLVFFFLPDTISLLKYLHLLLYFFFLNILLGIKNTLNYDVLKKEHNAINQEKEDNAVKLHGSYIAKFQFPLEIHYLVQRGLQDTQPSQTHFTVKRLFS